MQTLVEPGRAVVQRRYSFRQGGHAAVQLGRACVQLIHSAGVGGQSGVELVVAVQLGLERLQALEGLRLGLLGGR